MTVSNIWILGGYQSDFARNFTREELDFANLAEEVVNHTLDAAKVPATDIEVIHVGNASGNCLPAKVSWARCPPPCIQTCGVCPRLGTRRRAHRAVSLYLQRWQTCAPATTTRLW